MRSQPEQEALLRRTGQKAAAKPHPGSKNDKNMYDYQRHISGGTLKQMRDEALTRRPPFLYTVPESAYKVASAAH